MHSQLLDSILSEFEDAFAGVSLVPPTRPFISCVTGTWITDEDATDPKYWVRHLRGTVQFWKGLTAVLEEPLQIE